MNINKLKELLKPVKTTDDLAKVIVDLLQTDKSLDENIKFSKLYKYIIPFLLGLYSKDFVDTAIDRAKEIMNGKDVGTEVTVEPSENQQVNMFIKEYCKKYGVKESVIRNMLKKESMFDIKNNSYDANVIGDLDNTLGPSYGPGQIKVSTAKEIYIRHPEKDIDPNGIDRDKLKNDIEFNIRTMCKLVKHYYNKFHKTKNDSLRWALAATAYNRGINKTIKAKVPNEYGKYVANITKENKSLFVEYLNIMNTLNPHEFESMPIEDMFDQILSNLPDEVQLNSIDGDVLTLKRIAQNMNFESPSVNKIIGDIIEDAIVIRTKLRNITSHMSQVVDDLSLKKKKISKKVNSDDIGDTWHGKSKGKTISDFDLDSLKDGARIEMEHTDDAKIALRIAMDHLSENPEYYNKLKQINK